MMRRPVLEFWYEFASPYAYLAAMRIEALGSAAGVDIRWRPFLLGPVFAALGMTTSPFNLHPAKGRYMWRDAAREAERLGLAFRRPDPFPQNTLAATRTALLGVDRGWTPAFTRAIYAAEFGEGRSLADPAPINGALVALGLDPASTAREASGDANKTRLRAVGEEARSRGVFGAPTFFSEDGEMFWGNDRLEQAVAWAAGER